MIVKCSLLNNKDSKNSRDLKYKQSDCGKKGRSLIMLWMTVVLLQLMVWKGDPSLRSG